MSINPLPSAAKAWASDGATKVFAQNPPTAPKMRVLADDSKVALTIDCGEWPYRALLIRGTAHTEAVDGVTPEYAASAQRYFGADGGRAWVEGMRRMTSQMARITVRPEWVGILDFESRFPSAIEDAMSGQ